ncbi:MAG TPA: hypothetical protein DCM87_10715 [Planctomycetes bacterium]|nr:hypothetical protein [Planctomycetota bacterium]
MAQWRDVLRSLALPLGSVGGVPLRLHVSFFLVFALGLVASRGSVTWSVLLSVCAFVLVLVHEVAHLLALRLVGGYAREALLWPLGGLSAFEIPLKPLAQCCVAVAGPLAHLIVYVVFLPWMFMTRVPPMLPDPAGSGLEVLLATNQLLLVANLLPVFVTDGGRIWQTILWRYLGYGKATLATLLAGATFGAGFIAFGGVMGELFPALAGAGILAATLYGCASVAVDDEEEGVRVRIGSFFGGGYRRRRFFARCWHWLGKRRQEREHTRRAREARVLDELLAKIKARGLTALSDSERRFLHGQSSRLQRR